MSTLLYSIHHTCQKWKVVVLLIGLATPHICACHIT